MLKLYGLIPLFSVKDYFHIGDCKDFSIKDSNALTAFLHIATLIYLLILCNTSKQGSG